MARLAGQSVECGGEKRRTMNDEWKAEKKGGAGGYCGVEELECVGWAIG